MSSNARVKAYDVLSIVEEGEPLDAALSSQLNALNSRQDKAFLAELVKGTARYTGRYDYLIDKFTKRSPDPSIRILLRLGMYQLFNCNSVPDYAAVNETVNAARKVGFHKVSSFINAVLQNVRRTVESNQQGLIGLFPSPEKEPLPYLVSWYSHPEWMVKRWLEKYSFADCEKLCAHNNCPAPLTLHLSPKSDRSELFSYFEKRDIEYFESDLVSSAVVVKTRLPRDGINDLLSEFRQVIVQDQSVQSAMDFFSTHISGHVLDMCAAPGGKSINMLWRMPADATLVAMDSVKKRMDKVVDNLERVGESDTPLLVADGLKMPFTGDAYDTILLDGPCSGTGVMRHHPEGRWQLTEKRILKSGEMLFQLAQNAIDILAPGGKLLYATCSLEPEENEVVIKRLVDENSQLSVVEKGKYWLPQTDGADGFFAAIVTRVK